MKENRDCKIVQDLLPNYLENLTDEITKEYIAEHISKCPKCAQVLKDMDGEIKLEEINQDQEIKYLKKVKKRWMTSISIIAVILIIIAMGVVTYIHQESKLQITNYTFLRAQSTIPDTAGEDGYVDVTLMAVIDEKGKCKSARVVYKGYTEEGLKEQYEKYLMTEDNMGSNLQIIKNQIHRNINIWNGRTKEQLIQYWINSYNVKEIEEI